MMRGVTCRTELSFVQTVLAASTLHLVGLIALHGIHGRSLAIAVTAVERPAEEVAVEIEFDDSRLGEVGAASLDEGRSSAPIAVVDPPARGGAHVGTDRTPERRTLALRDRPSPPAAEPRKAPETTASAESANAPGSGAHGQSASEVAGLDSAAPRAAQRRRASATVNLGLGPAGWTRWMPAAIASSAPANQASAGTEKPRGYSTAGGLREALEAHDQELGLGPGGTVLTAARTAAHSEVAPQLGRASFVAVVLRDGAVSVSIESCNSDASGWKQVADVMRKELMRKPPTIDAGRTGIRITLEVSAEEHWPNGATTKSEAPHIALDLPRIRATDEALEDLKKKNPTAVADPTPDPALPPLKINVDLPGVWLKGKGKGCTYAAGITPSSSFPFVGLTVVPGCDPSNIGAKPIRVVATRILRQSPI